MKKTISIILLIVMCFLGVMCEVTRYKQDKNKALEINALIEKIGEDDIDSYEAIKNLYKDYNDLTKKQKTFVTNSDKLIDVTERVEQAQKFAEKLSLLFDTKHSDYQYSECFRGEGDNIIIHNCWYYYDERINDHYFTYEIGKRDDSTYREYFGNGTKWSYGEISEEYIVGFDNLTDEFIDDQIRKETNEHIYDDYNWNYDDWDDKYYDLFFSREEVEVALKANEDKEFADNLDKNVKYAYTQKCIKLDSEKIQEYLDKNCS